MTETRVEVFGFSLSEKGHLLALRRGAPLDDGAPDAVARRLAGVVDSAMLVPDGVLLHSTSWRYEHGQLVLTYAVAPDPGAHHCDGLWLTLESRAARPVTELTAPGRGPFTPTDVALHACRHLAFLVRTDAAVSRASRLQPLLWAQILRHAPDVATLSAPELTAVGG